MRRFEARTRAATAVGLSLVLAPLFALASSLVCPGLKGDERAQLDVIAQHPTRWYWFTLLLLVGSILLVPALLGIAALVRERTPRLGDLGGGLAVFGALVAIGDVMSQLMSWQMVAAGADRPQMAALLARFDQAAGVGIVFTVGGLATIAGALALTVGLIRGRAAPAWAAVALSLVVVVNIAGFSAASNGVVAVSWAILLLAMAPIARGVLAPRPRGGVVGDLALAPRGSAGEAR